MARCPGVVLRHPLRLLVAVVVAGIDPSGTVWKSRVPCLCTKSVIALRTRDASGRRHWRPFWVLRTPRLPCPVPVLSLLPPGRLITGDNLLRRIGFADSAGVHDETARLLTGNAFSGFTFAAVALAALVGIGRLG